MDLPAVLHAPRFGSVEVASRMNTLLRCDVAVPLSLVTSEIKVGELPQPEGDYLLPAGQHEASIDFVVMSPSSASLGDDAPAAVRGAVSRHRLSPLTYRPDVGSFSNSGASMPALVSADTWAAVSARIGDIVPGLSPTELLRTTLERWLDDAPTYPTGRTAAATHRFEDVYLHPGPACVQAVADYLGSTADAEWLQRQAERIARQIERLKRRDLDGDGLIESQLVTGNSGEKQWGSNWLEIISFGWKDAYVNAVLHRALGSFAGAVTALGRADLAEGLNEWQTRIGVAYGPTLLNPATRWFAGWRSKDGALHDYAFPAVNALAVTCGLADDEVSRRIMQALWSELDRVGFRDFRLGLPTNLWPVPDAEVLKGFDDFPFGTITRGGASFVQAHHFVEALYRVGMESEGDLVLSEMCAALADDAVVGGAGIYAQASGLEWTTWDGTPSGYEGLLTDQFGILATALDRYPLGIVSPLE